MSDQSPRSQIVIDVLPSGKVGISSTCLGEPDSTYAPMSDLRAPAELVKLIAELRERESGFRK